MNRNISDKYFYLFSMTPILLIAILTPPLVSVNAQASDPQLGNEEGLSSMMKVSDVSESNENSSKSNVTTKSPLPETAIGPTIPSKGYLVEEIRDKLFWVTDGVYNTMFLVSDDGVIVVDAPPSLGENLIKAIKEVTNQPIKFVVYSHSHTDHIGAAGTIFPDNVTIVAQEETANALKLANDSNRPVPDVTFKDKYQLTLGNQTLELSYNGTNHVPGNTYIYAPSQKTLMLVDVIFPGWAPFKDLAITADVPGFIRSHDIVLGYDFDTFIGGHLTRLGTVDDVKLQKEFVNDLVNASKQANTKVNFGDFVNKYGLTNPWFTLSEYTNAVTNDCVQTMVPKWGDRLGGLKEFIESDCWKMTESHRVD